MTIKVSEVSKGVRSSNSSVFKNMNDGSVSKVVSASFKAVLKELDSVEEGNVRFAGLGTFIIKKVDIAKEDGSIESKKRIRFRPAAEV